MLEKTYKTASVSAALRKCKFSVSKLKQKFSFSIFCQGLQHNFSNCGQEILFLLLLSAGVALFCFLSTLTEVWLGSNVTLRKSANVKKGENKCKEYKEIERMEYKSDIRKIVFYI